MTNSVATPSKGPVVAFLVILLLGILIAAFLFRDMFQKSLQQGEETASTEVETTDMPDTSSTPSNVTETSPPTDTSSQPSTAMTDQSAYMTDSVLVTDLTNALKAGDLATFIQLVGPSGLPEGTVTKLRSLIVDKKFTVDPSAPFTQVNGTEWVINLVPPSDLSKLGKQQVSLSLAKDPAKGWAVEKVGAPDINSLIANMKESQEGAPMQIAQSFLDAVVARDFKSAKTLVNSDKLSDEKLAALFIVVEEGTFQKRADKPLIPTIVQDTTAWVIARLQSAEKKSEFGIEMAREGAGQEWKVAGLNFDQLMTTVAMESGAGDIAYAPLVTDMKSGDSLVLFFEFDDSGVNTRASKQLEIIASILKEDPKRVLHINGHADAKGDENYNEQLSNFRAASVRSALVSMGVPDKQIETKAFGESAPKAPNLNPDGTDNPSGRAQNRRAEVYLQF